MERTRRSLEAGRGKREGGRSRRLRRGLSCSKSVPLPPAASAWRAGTGTANPSASVCACVVCVRVCPLYVCVYIHHYTLATVLSFSDLLSHISTPCLTLSTQTHTHTHTTRRRTHTRETRAHAHIKHTQIYTKTQKDRRKHTQKVCVVCVV